MKPGIHGVTVTTPLNPKKTGTKVIISDTQPQEGNVLWFNTSRGNVAAGLRMNKDESGSVVQANIEGEIYGVENASVNAGPTDKTYDFTVL